MLVGKPRLSGMRVSEDLSKSRPPKPLARKESFVAFMMYEVRNGEIKASRSEGSRPGKLRTPLI